MLSKKTIIRLHFLLAILAVGIGCCDFMYTQESFMSGVSIMGPGILLAVMIWLPMLLPNEEKKFSVPPLGIVAFALFIFYTLAMLMIDSTYEMTFVEKIVRMSMHVFFLLTMIGAYRWFSFNDIKRWDKIGLCVVFGMLVINYGRIFLYCISNLHVPHLNTSYYILFALPLVMLVKSWKVKGAFIFLASVILFSSMKRGGTAAMVLSLVVYVMVYLKIRSYNIVKAFAMFVVALVVIGAVAFALASSEMEGEEKNLVERFESVGDDGGSSRDYVYSTTLNLIASQEGLGVLFGNGYNAVLTKSPIHLSAHNDYMEILYDYGLIGFLLYLVFTLSFFRLSFRAFKENADIAPVLCFQFSNFIILGNISHIFIYMLMPLVTFTYGMGLGRMRKLASEAQEDDNKKEE